MISIAHAQATGGNSDMFLSLLPFLIISIPFACANYFLAKRLGKSPMTWAVLSLIPLFSWGFNIYVWYTTAFTVLDRLAALSAGRAANSAGQ